MQSFSQLHKQIKPGELCAVCVIVEVKGSAPAPVGTKLLVYRDGSISGTIGGGRLEKAVITDALNCLRTRKSKLYKHDLLHQHSMCCGGTVYVYIEPQLENPHLYIFGAGHIGTALASLCGDVGFDVFVIDERKSVLDGISIPGVNKMNLEHTTALQALPFNPDTYVCIMTHDHAIDREILRDCIKREHAYLGMIGSQRKTEVTRKMFLESGFANEEQLNSAEMPMGIDIGAQTPKEIAVSILARLIEVKNKRRNG